jgi:hypothetical protein
MVISGINALVWMTSIPAAVSTTAASTWLSGRWTAIASSTISIGSGMLVARLPEHEALAVMANSPDIRERPARTDGEAGLRVLAVLEAASRSLADSGSPASVEGSPALVPDAGLVEVRR